MCQKPKRLPDAMVAGEGKREYRRKHEYRGAMKFAVVVWSWREGTPKPFEDFFQEANLVNDCEPVPKAVETSRQAEASI